MYFKQFWVFVSSLYGYILNMDKTLLRLIVGCCQNCYLHVHVNTLFDRHSILERVLRTGTVPDIFSRISQAVH